MDLKEITNSPVIKKYGLWIVGGLVAVYLAYKYLGSSSSATSSTASDYASYLNAQNALQAQTAQYAYAGNAQAIAATEQQNTLNAQLAATQGAQTVQGVQAVGTALSSIIQAQDILPATIVNAAASDNQTALTAGADVAMAGLNAVPGSVNAAANALLATEQPWDALAQSTSNSNAQAFNSLATTANPATAAAASAAGASANASAAENQSSNGLFSNLATVATVAAIAA